MRRRFAVRICGVLLALSAAPVFAEAVPLERVFQGPPLNGVMAQGVRPSPDGAFIGYVRPAADDAAAAVLWVMPATGGAARPVVDTRKLGAAATELTEARMKLLDRRHSATGDALDYQWSADGQQLLVTFGDDLFLVGVADGAVRRLTQDATLELDPQLAPDGRRVSFVRDGQLVVVDLATRQETAVCPDAKGPVSCGTSEFVAQEEMQRFTGAWWSPDGGRLAYTRVDETRVKTIPRVRIDSADVSVVDDRYPLTGTPNAVVGLFIRDAARGAPLKVDLGADDDIYLFNAAWSRDGRTLYVIRQSRDQKRVDLLAVDPATGKSRVILSETSTTWVDLERDFRPLKDGNFLWGSSRTGWRHLYLYSADGKLIRPVTQGDWRIAWVGPGNTPDFAPIVAVDEDKGEVWFVASKETPVEQHLWRVSYRTPGEPVKVTRGAGWWVPAMAQGNPTAFVARYTDPETPPNTALYGLDGKRIAWIAENRLDETHAFARYRDQAPTYSFGTIKAATGDVLHYMLAKPAGFDPTRRYPVVMRPYAGPGVQTVKREWQGRTEQLLTQAGYLVFKLDSRGSSNRSTAFEHALHDNLGGANTEDQLAGVKFLAGLPYVDPERIGMMGWSFGAYMTYRMMTTPGSGIRAGAAGGVPSAFELYDTHYTERFLGTPQQNLAAYRASNLKGRAGNLSGNLLLLHGLSDDNVVIANFTALAGELQQAGKLHETAVYPGQSHVFRGEKVMVHLWKTYLDFFERRLKPAVVKPVAP